MPVYCVSLCPATFDRPTKAVFSSDGTTAYVLNCGPECGGTEASISFLPMAGIVVQSGAPVPPGAHSAVSATIPVPGGVTNALPNGMSSISLASNCSRTVSFPADAFWILGTKQITGTYSISDGTHTQMTSRRQYPVDWLANLYPRRALPAGRGGQLGCLTMFNTANNSVTMIDTYKGDATGIAAVTGLHKVYTAEGGQVYIYSTVDGYAARQLPGDGERHGL